MQRPLSPLGFGEAGFGFLIGGLVIGNLIPLIFRFPLAYLKIPASLKGRGWPGNF